MPGKGGGTTGASAAGGDWGMYPGAGTGAAPSFLLNEPMGGGALETGAAGDGAGMSDPGNGGGTLAVGGTAIWPISGTTLSAAAGGAGGTAVGLIPAVGEGVAVSSFNARLICTTASTHSVPQAIAEERSRSEVRVEDGGVTSC